MEDVFTIPGAQKLPKKIPGYVRKVYPSSYVTTVYFGGRKNRKTTPTLLSHAAVKVRIYHAAPRGDIFVLEPDSLCVVEIKRRPKEDAASVFRSKVRFGENKKLELRKFLDLIAHTARHPRKGRGASASKLKREVASLLDEYGLDQLEPLAATSYCRSHYHTKDHRITLDTDIRYYLAAKHAGNVLFLLVRSSQNPTLEVKSSAGTFPRGGQCPAVSALEKKGFHIARLKGTETKGAVLFRLLQKNSLHITEPELTIRSDSDWIIFEREIKLDGVVDLRSALALVPSRKRMVMGTTEFSKNYQRLYRSTVNSQSALVLGWNLRSPDSGRIIKYKSAGTITNNVLIRKETVIPYSYPQLLEILRAAPTEVIFSPEFKRERMSRMLYLSDTKNIFEIQADTVSFVKDASAPRLYQLEIEFIGILHNNKKRTKPTSFLAGVYRDFKTIQKFIQREYASQKIVLKPSFLTKSEWVAEHGNMAASK